MEDPAIEDALTFEMIIILATGFQHRGIQLFNPKLINAGTAGRKRDLYLNTAIDCYVECILIANNRKPKQEEEA